MREHAGPGSPSGNVCVLAIPAIPAIPAILAIGAAAGRGRPDTGCATRTRRSVTR